MPHVATAPLSLLALSLALVGCTDDLVEGNATGGLTTSAGESSSASTGATTSSTSASTGGSASGSASSTSTSATTAEPTTSGATTMSTSGSTASTTSGTDTDTDTGTTGDPEDELRYDQVRQKSAHNSYQRDESLLDLLVTHRVRSIELDIHVGKTLKSKVPGDWYVYHTDVLDDDSACERLSHCLDLLAGFHAAVPEHEVVTLWIDLKDNFDADHRPIDLDARLMDALPGVVLTPAELLAACPGATTLQASVTDPGCAWPDLASLRGRVIVALTGGGLDDPKGSLATYVGVDPTARLAFAAPDLGDAAKIGAHPEAIVHNLAAADVDLAVDVRGAGLVSRTWVLDTAGAWMSGVGATTHHLATNKVNALIDAWSSTAGPGGWPFTCFDACDPPAVELGEVVTIAAESGDLWSSSDDAIFAGHPLGGQALTVSALIAVPSSHVEEWGKGCLMARAGDGPDAANFAVCRPADNNPIQVQYRLSQGTGTQNVALAPPAGFNDEAPAFARLEVDADGMCARGFGSIDGATWVKIDERCFAAPLTHIGISGSTNDGGPIRFHFVGLEEAPGGSLEAADLEVVAFGGAKGDALDGL